MVRFVVVMLMLGALAGCDLSAPEDGTMVEPPPRTINQSQLSHGERVYRQHCKKCHGVNGKGAADWRIQGPDGKYPPPPLNGDGHTWHHPTVVLEGVILDGSPGGMGNMPAFRSKLDQQELDAVIAWIKSLWSEEAYKAWYQRELSQQGHH